MSGIKSWMDLDFESSHINSGSSFFLLLGYDVCGMVKDPGTCGNWEVRWFFNTEIDRCDRFWYGGCNEGNENNFMNEEECQQRCTNVGMYCVKLY